MSMPHEPTSTLDFNSTCTRCREQRRGRLYFNAVMKVVDSDGGLLFVDGWSCANCLGEPYMSGDATSVVLG